MSSLYGFDITDGKNAEQAREWIFEHSLDMLCIAGFDGYFKRVSPSFEKVLGWSEAELLAKPLFDFIHPDDRESTLQAAKGHEVGKEAVNLVNRCRCKDGSYKWVSWNFYRMAEKQIVIAVARDVTEDKRAEEALRTSEEKFASIFRSSPDAIVLTTVAEGRFLEVNDEFTRLTGYARDEVLGRTVFDLGIWSDPNARKQLVSLVDQQGSLRGFEWKMRNKSGELRSVAFSGGKIELSGQACLVCIWRDITEQQQALDALRRQALMIENMHDAVLVVDHDYNISDWNKAANRMFGYEKTEVLGRNVSCLHPPEVAERQELSIRKELEAAGRFDGELAAVRKDGTEFMIRAVIVPLRDEHGTQIGTIGVSRDITERKLAEDKLRESESRYRSLFDNMINAFALVRIIFEGDRPVDMEYLAVNRAFETLTGLKDVVGKRLTELFPSIRETDPKLLEIYGGAARTGAPMQFEIWIEGLKVWHSVSLHCPAPDCLGVVFEVITERKQAENALRTSERKYRELVEKASFGIFRSTLDGQFLDVNPALVAMLGYSSKEELMMRNLKTDIYENPSQRASVLARYESSDHVENAETTWRRKDGTLINVRANGRRVCGEDGQIDYFEVMVEDVTERYFLEEELRRAQKMEAVGRLAGGVAHDFNNVLMAIQMNGSLLLGGLVPPDRLQEKARDILASADRGAALSRKLLAFGRKQALEPVVVDLNDLLRGILSLMQGLIPENIAATASLCQSLGLVKIDPTQFEHVMINLITNARDAMPHGGQLIVETSNVDASGRSKANLRVLPPGQYVMVAVSDTGIGMDASTQARIFEPFFTTKLERGGTGLGLATSYGTVRQSGGYIFVYSERGRGTTFKVYFPTVGGEPKAFGTVAEQDAELASVRGHGEAILLVEDEDLVRKATAEFLSASGYIVLEARNGSEALQVAKSHPFDIAAVVTDVIMPGIDGREVVEILRQSRPQLKAVLMSGYTESKMVEDQEATSFTFLQKPFTAKVLARMLRRVLDMF